MRRTGKTTRIIDRIIQELFKNKKAFIYESRTDLSINENLKKRVLQRLHVEHEYVQYSVYSVLDSGINCFVIELIE